MGFWFLLLHRERPLEMTAKFQISKGGVTEGRQTEMKIMEDRDILSNFEQKELVMNSK